MTFVMFIVFISLMIFGMPIFLSLLLTAFTGFIYMGNWNLFTMVIQQFYGGMDMITLMAIPFFILTGNLMNKTGITDKLLEFSQVLVGHLRGGLGHVNVVASIIFAGISGSAAADASALGSILIPAMAKEGYPRSYAAGITAGSSLIGPIIPPSIFMVLYGSMTNTSIGSLFVAGIIPGFLLGLAFMIMNYYVSKKNNYPVANKRASLKKIAKTTLTSLIALMAPLIIVGSIVFGIATPTEGGVIAVVYTVLIGFFVTKKLKIKDFIESITETIITSSVIYVIIGSATVISWLLKWERVPQKFADYVLSVTDSRLIILLVFSLVIFIIGMFMEEVAVLTLLTPIFLPVATSVGINPVHFGIIMTLNITVALITPPMGACVYITSAVGDVNLEALMIKIWPFVLVAMIVVLMIILFPSFTLMLPRLFGF